MLPRIGKQGRRIVPFIFRASAEKHHSVTVAIEDQSVTQARSRSYVLSLSPKLSVELPGVSKTFAAPDPPNKTIASGKPAIPAFSRPGGPNSES